MERGEEQRLIRRAARGDREAAGAIIRAHQKSVYAYLLRLSGKPDVAEDVTQEAFVRVLTNLERFDPRYRFSTWVFTIARRLYVNACQKHKPAFDTEIVDAWQGDDAGATHSLEGDEGTVWARTSLDKALGQLSPQQREIIVLFHQMDWPIALIAQHVGMPEGTVKSHLHRGRRRMREFLVLQERFVERVREVLP